MPAVLLRASTTIVFFGVVIGAARAARHEEMINCLLESSVQQRSVAKGADQILTITSNGIPLVVLTFHLFGQMKPMQRIQKEQGSDLVVEIGTYSSELVEGVDFGKKCRGGRQMTIYQGGQARIPIGCGGKDGGNEDGRGRRGGGVAAAVIGDVFGAVGGHCSSLWTISRAHKMCYEIQCKCKVSAAPLAALWLDVWALLC